MIADRIKQYIIAARLGGDRIASAIRMDEIPAKYRGLPLVNRGTTAIVLRLNDDHVVVLTRDHMKKDYLTDVLGAKVDPTLYESSKATKYRHLQIFALKMPLLHKLSGRNLAVVKKQLTLLDPFLKRIIHSPDDAQHIFDEFREDRPGSIFEPFVDFIVNYDKSQYLLDLGKASNYRQTSDGKIVVLDPVISREVYDIIRPNRY